MYRKTCRFNSAKSEESANCAMLEEDLLYDSDEGFFKVPMVTKRKVGRGEELTWFYSEEYSSHMPSEQPPCTERLLAKKAAPKLLDLFTLDEKAFPKKVARCNACRKVVTGASNRENSFQHLLVKHKKDCDAK